MPSLPYTPGGLVLTGGEIHPEPIRFYFTAGFLRLTGASYAPGPNLSSGLSALLAAVLDTLSAGEAIVDAQGRPTRRFAQIWQNAMEAIKDAFTSQGGEITELQAIYAAINTAQATASTAVQTVQAADTERALVESYTNPVGVTTASSSGTITIAAHDRIYTDGTTVTVNGGSVSGFSPGQLVTVYYVDTARAGGAVAYQGTTSAVAQGNNVHVVGQAAIPAVGETDAAGIGPIAPGYPSPPTQYDPRLIEYEQNA